MEEQIIKILTNNLNDMDIDYNAVDNKTISYLIKIETFILENKKNKHELLEDYRNKRLTISKISTESNISRQTFYNNTLLNDYVKIAISKDSKTDLNSRIDKLQNEIKSLKDIIDKLMIRDIKIELLSIEIDELKSQYIDYKNTNNLLNQINH